MRLDLMSREEKIAMVCTLALVVLTLVAIGVLCGCRATGPACLRAGAATGHEGAAALVTPPGLSKPAAAALQRAQTATACVSTEVTAARKTLAADVAPTLPGPAAAVDARLGKAERAAAEIPPALQGLAAEAVKAKQVPATKGDEKLWRWAAWAGSAAILVGMAALAAALIWGLGTPKLGAGIAGIGATVAITSYVWQTWAVAATVAAGCVALAAVLYAAWINREALKAALRFDGALKAGYSRDTAKAVAVAEQSPAVAAAIRRAKDVLPILPPLPPATPTPPPNR